MQLFTTVFKTWNVKQNKFEPSPHEIWNEIENQYEKIKIQLLHVPACDAYWSKNILISSNNALCFHSCVSSASLALWGQVSFYQDSGTWAEGLFGERAQLIDFLSSPCCCCGKLLWILENSCWGSFVLRVFQKKRTQQQALSKKNLAFKYCRNAISPAPLCQRQSISQPQWPPVSSSCSQPARNNEHGRMATGNLKSWVRRMWAGGGPTLAQNHRPPPAIFWTSPVKNKQKKHQVGNCFPFSVFRFLSWRVYQAWLGRDYKKL